MVRCRTLSAKVHHIPPFRNDVLRSGQAGVFADSETHRSHWICPRERQFDARLSLVAIDKANADHRHRDSRSFVDPLRNCEILDSMVVV
jgi:hypothetical protein